MKLTQRAGLVGLSLGAAAILATTATLTGAVASAAPPPPTVPACDSAQMTVWTGFPSDTATSHSFWQLQISNVGRHACTLQGYPGVSVLNASGHQVGRPASRNPSTTPLVTIPAGGTAHVVLAVVSPFVVCPHHVVHGTELRVFAPNQFHAERTPFSVSVCPHTVTMHVDAVHAGAGIPGFTNR